MSASRVTVVFRTNRKDGDVCAVFPYEPERGRLVACYSPRDGHGTGDLDYFMRACRPSTLAEIAPVKRALLRLGYKIDVRRRVSRRLVSASRV